MFKSIFESCKKWGHNMNYPCWQCRRYNIEENDGYCYYKECGLWYAPMKEKKEPQRALNDKEIV